MIGNLTVRGPLTRDEETELHHRIAKGREAAATLAGSSPLAETERRALRATVRRGRQAEEDLLAGTYALVKKRINDLGFQVDRDELEGAGVEGLVKALREFDPDHGVRFATYANYWISKMVFAAISHRVPYPEPDLRLVIKYRRLRRQHDPNQISSAEVMKLLGLTRAQAGRVMKMSDDIAAGIGKFDEEHHEAPSPESSEPWPEAEWVIDRLKEILGSEFADFWMWTGRVMTLEELGRRNGISKQAMAKRVQRWRRLVESSEHADEMLAWLRAQ
jgi:RNA polymerase sigma factor (sigma-70 family)